MRAFAYVMAERRRSAHAIDDQNNSGRSQQENHVTRYLVMYLDQWSVPIFQHMERRMIGRWRRACRQRQQTNLATVHARILAPKFMILRACISLNSETRFLWTW